MLLILGATWFEIAGLKGRAQAQVVRTGMGRARVRETLAGLRRRPAAVLNLGFAGGLDDRATPGRAYLVRRVARGGGDDAVELDGGLLGWARSVLPGSPGEAELTTTASILEGPEEKRRVGGLTGASLVDLEGYWIAAWARAAQVPALVLKVVLDGHQDTLPRALWPRLALAPPALRARRVLARAARPLIAGWEEAS